MNLRVVERDDGLKVPALAAVGHGMAQTHRHLVDLYLQDLGTHLAPSTVKQNRSDLGAWLAFVERRGVGPGALTKRILLEYLSHLQLPGALGRATVRRYVQTAHRYWAWLHEEQRDLGLTAIEPARMVKLPPLTTTPARAPSWDEMDAAIAALGDRLDGAARLLAIVLRCTGLRVSQGMRLEWRDLDFAKGTLTVRGELGKSAAERAGRKVPLAPVLVDELEHVERRCDFVVSLPRRPHGGGMERKSRTITTRQSARAWAAAGVAEDLWRRQGWHAFRKGFETGLIALGAPPHFVEVLLGHQLQGQLKNYVDPRALPLEQVVALVPPIRRVGTQLALPGVV